jgi:hypothetical protein
MLQRIQSVYLTLVFVFTGLAIFIPLGTFEVNALGIEALRQATQIPLKITGPVLSEFLQPLIEKSNLSIVLLIFSFGIMVLSVFTIFQFKKRRLQIQVGKFMILLLVGHVVTIFSFIDHYKDFLSEMTFSHGAGVFLPLASMILVLLTIRSIKKDELLVRSADRIR